MTLKPIKPKGNDPLNARAIERAVKNTLNAVAKGAKVDFGVVTRTWKNKPEFVIETPDDGTRIVKTEDTIFKYVNDGTRPHIIRPKHARVLTWIGTAYRAKTIPGVIRSTSGGNDNTIVHTKIVQHPGTKARNFDIAIRDKWAQQMHIRMQSAIMNEMKSWSSSS